MEGGVGDPKVGGEVGDTGAAGGLGGGGVPGPAKGDVVTFNLGPAEVAPTAGAPGTFNLSAG
jgi:hypothetical protein